MGKKYRNLFERITAPDNLWTAYQRAAKGRRNSGGYLNFREYEAYNLRLLRERLLEGSYFHGDPRIFTVREPKPRVIAALPFEDRVVQHALHGVTAPIFEAGMLPQSYACREGRGTHSGAIKAQAMMRKMGRSDGTVYALKTDYSKYFASIQREPLWRRIDAKISCRATLWLIERFVPRTGTGLDIGWLTSQLFANVNGTQVDRYLAQHCRESRFLRYMDDVVVFGYERDYLFQLKDKLERYSNEALGLRFSKWNVQPVTRGVNFLGYRIWPTHKLLRKDSVRRAKRKITRYAREGETEELRKFLASWGGHAKWADSRNLINSLALTYKSTKKDSANVLL
ncbi:reverse transcriptase domain-containing protein [Halomonas sp. Mc5H-6]|uniref:reverse transcriptase domain-containing protein n=1 Tax=Halomonas sp. Mc5H-6 TaxID=2954500 RepID=UPI0020970D7A|nr:reverse transcriptase domain-containing protein [Halomonas sp. Mc5H-6]MCO7248175.1 reverse transcriptase domain-containing protein [Halomonas sp. Mc5H-6]